MSGEGRPKVFGGLLAALRERTGTTQEQFAEALGVPRSTVATWEQGKTTPGRRRVELLANALGLDEEETNRLLLAANYAPPELQVQESAQTLDARLESLAATVEALAAQVRQQEGNSSVAALTPIMEKLGELEQSVVEARQAGQQVTVASQELVARFDIPKDMVIKMVPVTEINNLEQHRSDQNKWATYFGLFLGSIIGVFINVATGGSLTTVSWLFLVFLGLMGFVTWRFEEDAKKRANELIGRLLSGQADKAD